MAKLDDIRARFRPGARIVEPPKPTPVEPRSLVTLVGLGNSHMLHHALVKELFTPGRDKERHPHCGQPHFLVHREGVSQTSRLLDDMARVHRWDNPGCDVLSEYGPHNPLPSVLFTPYPSDAPEVMAYTTDAVTFCLPLTIYICRVNDIQELDRLGGRTP